MRLRIDITRVDRWRELGQILRRNLLRTILTSLAVAWGIFMLIILLGAGKGLQNSVEDDFRDDAQNSIFVRRGQTSMPFKGRAVGKQIRFSDADYDQTKVVVPEADHITARYGVWQGLDVSRGTKYSNYRLRGVHPDHQVLEQTIMVRGRYINEIDLTERRKVCVISVPTSKFFFGGQNPIGETLNVGGIAYTVVGIFTDVGSDRELEWIYVPVTTAQVAYGPLERIHMVMFTMGDATAAESKVIAERVKADYAARHGFDPNDKRALRLNNNLEQIQDVKDIFAMINLFVWVLGIGTIFAGVIGVSNIMLIAVRERTKEFGVRKALGATPWSIISMVLQEAIVLTATAGYVGMIAGIGLLEVYNKYVPPLDGFRNPAVDLSIAISATVVLVVAGAIAGFIPAWQAAKVKPITALRDE